jgi:acetaldehyde dehydrogenase (acetylating)
VPPPAPAPVSEASALIERAHTAWLAYRSFSQSQVDAIVGAMAAAATANAERLAALAVEETTYGKVADKTRKNRFASEKVYAAIRSMPTVGFLRQDRERGIVELGTPVGVVAAVLPCTNPTSTAIYKILIALKAGNAIVLSPHPAAMRCICDTVSLMRQAALAQGAPDGLIGCFSTPTREGTNELMTHPRTRVILATGGMGIVRAAYSSGKPAFGVGPGNVPAFIDVSADLPQAVEHVLFGKSFDWGTICSSEQSIVAEARLREPILAELQRKGAYLLTPDETARLGALLIQGENFTVNPACVGQSPQKLAALAGFESKVGPDVRVLAAELDGMGKQHPLSAEKLSPVLALFFLPDREAALKRCSDLLHFGGLGHTCVIHATDEAIIREYGARMPAFRVVVNTPSPLGSIGATTNLFPAMTLGCGAVGGNITSDNIGPQHLMNIKRIAWPASEKRASEEGPSAPGDAPLRQAIEKALAERGIVAQPAFTPPPVAPKPTAVAFVCEADVRDAIKKNQKIPIGPRTLITPAARDLGNERDMFTPT